jgi:hypothetical protein
MGHNSLLELRVFPLCCVFALLLSTASLLLTLPPPPLLFHPTVLRVVLPPAVLILGNALNYEFLLTISFSIFYRILTFDT